MGREPWVMLRCGGEAGSMAVGSGKGRRAMSFGGRVVGLVGATIGLGLAAAVCVLPPPGTTLLEHISCAPLPASSPR